MNDFRLNVETSEDGAVRYTADVPEENIHRVKLIVEVRPRDEAIAKEAAG